MLKRRTFLAKGVASCCFVGGTTRAEQPAFEFGRHMITGFRGQTINDPEVKIVLDYIQRGELGGVLLLKRNVSSPEQLMALTGAFRAASNDFVPIIGLDQEGGRVARLGPENGFLKWESAEILSQSGMSDEEVLDYYKLRAVQLSSVGINVNFGPVVDLNINPANPIIGRIGRSFGRDVGNVTRLASLFVQAHHSASLKTCLKHFPGHGSSANDSHLGLVDVSNSWESEELEPYMRLIETGFVDAVMTAHVILDKMTEGHKVPFSLYEGMGRFVREVTSSDVPIFSDDMQMGAVVEHYGQIEAARSALNAGNTFLIYSNYRDEDRIDTVQNVQNAMQIERAIGNINVGAMTASTVLKSTFMADLK
jgi:beta-N-acetylhexosaminidase